MTNEKIAEYYDQFLPHLERDTRVANDRHVMIFKSLDWLCARKHENDIKHVLDIGCGVGVTSMYMAKRGCKVTAVDLAPKVIEFARAHMNHPNIEYLCEDATELNLGKTFDLITLCDIYEHIPGFRIKTFMDAMKRHVRDDTVIYLNIPDGRYISYILATQPELLQIVDNPCSIGEILDRFNEIGYHVLEIHSRGIDTRAQYTEYIFVQNGILRRIYDGGK